MEAVGARAFSPLGVVSRSSILGMTAFTNQTSLRLDTSWRFDDEAHGVTYRVGDAIGSGLPWTRPIRLGGFEVSHDFGERPDPGQIDFSAEAGYARLNYGVASFDYDRHAEASVSLRAGICDGLTLEGHS
jgi:outer membrane usher protein FimD/PapC